MWKFTIVNRMNTRSTSYNKSSVLRAILKAGLTQTEGASTQMSVVLVPTQELRKALEYELQQVDRNVAYRIERTEA